MEEITATIEPQTISGDAEATPIRYIADADLTELIGTKVDEYVEEHSGGFATEAQVSILEDFVSSHNDNFAPPWVKTQDYPAGVLIMDSSNNGAIYISKGFTASQVTDCNNLNEVMIKGYVTGYSVAELKTDFERSQYVQNVDIANLKAASKGVLYNEQTDSTTSRQKTVPTGALPYASLAMLGGMSRKGKNLFNPKCLQLLKKYNATTSNNNGVLHITTEGALTNQTNFYIANLFTLKAGTYTFNASDLSGIGTIQFSTSTSSFTQKLAYAQTVTLSADTEVAGVTLQLNEGITVDKDVHIQIEAGNTATDFEPYTDSLIDAKVDKVEWLGKYRNELTDFQWNWLNNNQNLWNNDDCFVINYKSEGIIIANYRNPEVSIKYNALYINDIFVQKNQVIMNDAANFGNLSDSIERYPTYFCKSGFTKTFSLDGYSRTLTVAKTNSTATINIPKIEPKTIPPQVIAKCPDYGIGINNNCFNYIDFEQKKYHRRVASVDMGSLSWNFSVSGSRNLFYTQVTNIRIMADRNVMPNLLTPKYATVTINTTWADGMISMRGVSSDYVTIIDNNYTDATAFKTAMQGVKLYYELATEEVIDLSDVWVDGMEMLEVESGGTIAFHYPQLDDGYEVDMPNSETYLIDLSEVI